MTTQKTEREEALEAEVKYLKQTLAIEQRKHAKCWREKHGLLSSSKAEGEMREALTKVRAEIFAVWGESTESTPILDFIDAALSPKEDGK